jgi:ABC-2 type transport system permease protein
MSRTLRAIIGILVILAITFASISVFQTVGKRVKVDVTEQRLYSLSDGTKAILGKLTQPITAKLYFAKTASLKGPDQIRFFNNYYEFVRALLEEYASVSKGMFKLEIIDPRPFSAEEEDAIRYGLERVPMSPEENFFFGLVVQTQFGVEKTIKFFNPQRQNFVEYDISYLIDNAVTRQKKRIGVMSSIAVMGDDVSDYMARMMAMQQGKQPAQPWTIVKHLKNQFEVTTVPTDVNDINDVDILLVIHPKGLPEKTQFAIDQYVLKGGRTIVCVDPYCYVDRPKQPPMGMQQPPPAQDSNLPTLLRAWGLEMPVNTFAGDTELALLANAGPNQRPQKLIGYLQLVPGCFNKENVITAQLNNVKMPFAGILKTLDDAAADSNEPSLQKTPLVMTTDRGNSWTISSPYELAMLDPERLRQKFIAGTEPVHMGYAVTGPFTTAFPNGIDISVQETDPNDPNETITVTKHVDGLTEATEKCAVVVFSDVDFISDSLAYQNSFFGSVVVGDNSNLLLNTIEDLSGSSDLISIRSRGNYQRPFTVVDEIEKQAERETADEVAKFNAEITSYNQQIQSLAAQGQEGNQQVIGSAIVQERRNLELKVVEARRQLNEVKLKRREAKEQLGNKLRQANMLATPAVILLLAIVLGIRRTVRTRHYVSHKSDA